VLFDAIAMSEDDEAGADAAADDAGVDADEANEVVGASNEPSPASLGSGANGFSDPPRGGSGAAPNADTIGGPAVAVAFAAVVAVAPTSPPAALVLALVLASILKPPDAASAAPFAPSAIPLRRSTLALCIGTRSTRSAPPARFVRARRDEPHASQFGGYAALCDDALAARTCACEVEAVFLRGDTLGRFLLRGDEVGLIVT
jgi:hypothetical protein